MEISDQALRDGLVGLLSLEERHVIEQVQDILRWRPPVFELWLQSAAEKQLLGLANSVEEHSLYEFSSSSDRGLKRAVRQVFFKLGKYKFRKYV